MNDVTQKNPSTMLAAGGGAFLVLAGYFPGRDLSLPPETVLLGVASVAAVGALLLAGARLVGDRERA
jgi:hypothetical protein